jgi:hypothetical protein
VQDLATLTERARDQLGRDVVRLTNGQVTSLNQVAQLRTWLFFQGVDMPDLKRDTVKAWLADPGLPDGPRKVLQARLDASRASTAKLAAIAAARSLDGRVKGAFQFYGAGRTGRWAGRRFQPQNLFRGSIRDVPAAIRAIRSGATPDDLAMLFEDSALGVVASCLRSTIMAAPLHRLVVADLSQIEARVLAWLAGQQDALTVFAAGKDIYTATANAIGSTNRQLGKVLVLAAGFGMGAERFRQTALSYNVVLSEIEAMDAVMAWRALNAHIVTLWWRLGTVRFPDVHPSSSPAADPPAERPASGLQAPADRAERQGLRRVHLSRLAGWQLAQTEIVAGQGRGKCYASGGPRRDGRGDVDPGAATADRHHPRRADRGSPRDRRRADPGFDAQGDAPDPRLGARSADQCGGLCRAALPEGLTLSGGV